MKNFITLLLTLSLLLVSFGGCKTTNPEKTYKVESEPGQFSRIRPRDPDSESMGMSSTSRSIERNLGVGE